MGGEDPTGHRGAAPTSTQSTRFTNTTSEVTSVAHKLDYLRRPCRPPARQKTERENDSTFTALQGLRVRPPQLKSPIFVVRSIFSPPLTVARAIASGRIPFARVVSCFPKNKSHSARVALVFRCKEPSWGGAKYPYVSFHMWGMSSGRLSGVVGARGCATRCQ